MPGANGWVGRGAWDYRLPYGYGFSVLARNPITLARCAGPAVAPGITARGRRARQSRCVGYLQGTSPAASVKRRPASSVKLLDAFYSFYCRLLLEVPLK